MYRKIVVPVDGSAFAEQALPLALAVACHTGAEVELIHVHVPTTPPAMSGEVLPDWTADAALQQQEQDYLDGLARRVAGTAEVHVTTTPLLSGPVSDELAGHAQATAADLVVMATHARGPLGRLLLGSVADRLIARSQVPLLLVRPQKVRPDLTEGVLPRRILVPLDGSARAEEILGPATDLGGRTGARFLLLRVVEPALPSSPIDPEGINTFGQSVLKRLEEQEAADCREAGAYLEGVARRLRSDGLTVQTLVVRNESPAAAILEQARAGAVDLIALATHGRTGIRRLFMGSVAEEVLRKTPCPVLTVKASVPAAAGTAEPVAAGK